MTQSIVSRLLKKGIMPTDPRFQREYERVEHEALAIKRGRVAVLVRGYKRTEAFDSPRAISAWLSCEGRGIRRGPVTGIEIWNQVDAYLLVVSLRNETEVFRIRKAGSVWVIVSRVL